MIFWNKHVTVILDASLSLFLTTVGGGAKINAPTQTNAATRNTHYQRQRHSGAATINEMKYYLCSGVVVFWALKFHIF